MRMSVSQHNHLRLPTVQEEIPRVPIVCTGNDFSTLYAPLIRDGRMEKFYWAPTREDRIGVCMGIFQHDGVTRGEVETIVDTFPGQSIDFFGALRVSHLSLLESPYHSPDSCACASSCHSGVSDGKVKIMLSPVSATSMSPLVPSEYASLS
jgi:hypothetical protein